jgi:hypothetical protein
MKLTGWGGGIIISSQLILLAGLQCDSIVNIIGRMIIDVFN